MKNSIEMGLQQTKMNLTLPQFQKESFLPTPNHVQSQTQGSFCDVGNSQTHVGTDGRALPVALGLFQPL